MKTKPEKIKPIRTLEEFKKTYYPNYYKKKKFQSNESPEKIGAMLAKETLRKTQLLLSGG